MNKLLSIFAIVVLASALTGCGPKEKHLLTGAAVGIVIGAAGAIAFDHWRKS